MNATANASKQIAAQNSQPTTPAIERFDSRGDSPSALAEIYQEQINIAIWERVLDKPTQQAISEFLARNPTVDFAEIVSPENTAAETRRALGDKAPERLRADICELIDMFRDLFELEQVGLRLATLHRAMCPRFHVDRVPCRLVTTYQGEATQWLPHASVDRSKLGPRSINQNDLEAGLYRQTSDIQQLRCGDVALMKGELWAGNENAGLVHRSPEVTTLQSRLLLTLDIVD